MTHKVKLYKQGKYTNLEVEDGKNLLQCIQENETEFFAPCGGNGTCGKCRVKIINDGHRSFASRSSGNEGFIIAISFK